MKSRSRMKSRKFFLAWRGRWVSHALRSLCRVNSILIIFVLSLPTAKLAGAEVLLPNGLFAGTLKDNDSIIGVSPIHYFVQSPAQVAEIIKSIHSPSVESDALETSRAYDHLIVVIHPSSVVGGRINPVFSSFLDNQQLEIANGILNTTQVAMRGCAVISLVFLGEVARENLRIAYVYSDNVKANILSDDLNLCLEHFFKLNN